MWNWDCILTRFYTIAYASVEGILLLRFLATKDPLSFLFNELAEV